MSSPTTDTKKTSPSREKPASRDRLVKGGKTGKVELSDDELNDVSGGASGAGPKKM